MTPIQSIDDIVIPYSREYVWRVLTDIDMYPHWWPPSLGLRVLSLGDHPVGAEMEITPKKGRSFRYRVVDIDPPSQMIMQYFGGFISGSGQWLLEPADGGTHLIYTIDAQMHGWMAKVLSLGKDLGEMHSHQMREVFEALVQTLRESVRSA